MKHVLIFLIRLYQYTLAPMLNLLAGGTGCRFEPSCSNYAIEALQRHGAFRGGFMAFLRICRCHPWGGAGYDPVPATIRRTGLTTATRR
jgi:putative membrane protein insertion efficiency factor